MKIPPGVLDSESLLVITKKGQQRGVTPSATAAGILLNNGQVPFPAVQNPSSDPNTLDDYEEGTFTPVIIGTTTPGAGTYSAQEGAYVKIGKVVYFSAFITWSAHTGTGNISFSIPFTAAASPTFIPLSCLATNLTFTGQLGANINAGAASGRLGVTATGAGYAQVAMDTSATISVSGFYYV